MPSSVICMNKKVLFITESLNIGGAEKALLSILKEIDHTEFDVTVKVISEKGAFLADLKSIHDVHAIFVVKEKNGWIASLLNKFIVKAIYSWLPAKIVGNYLCRGYDVAVAFCEGYLTKWVGASSVKCRKIAWVHTDMVDNDWPLRTGVFKTLEEEIDAYSRYDQVVGVTESVSEGMRNKFHCKNVTTVYNILDPQIDSKADEQIPELRRADLNLVGVGRLEEVKGFDILIEAMNLLLNKECLDIQLTIVGDGYQRGRLAEMIDEYHLTGNVSLVGRKSNPYPYVKSADVFVCPSRQEGFNIAILEAMSLGKPVVASKSVGPTEILKNGEYGILTKNDAFSLAEGIKSIMTEGQFQLYSNKSKERIGDFDENVQLKKLYRLLVN